MVNESGEKSGKTKHKKGKRGSKWISFDDEVVTKVDAEKILAEENLKIAKTCSERENGEENEINTSKRSKKRKKTKLDSFEDTSDDILDSCETVECENGEIGKKRKKKKKKSEMIGEEADVNEIIEKNQMLDEQVIADGESEGLQKVKKKKKRVKNVNEEDKNNAEATEENSEESDTPKKKRKKKDIQRTENEESQETENQESEESNPNKSKKTESIRAQKRKKHEQLLLDKKMKSELSFQQKALNYLSKWTHSREEWKFEKLRQIWLQQNMYDSAKLPQEFWETLVEYFSSSKGKAREVLVKDALKIIEAEDAESEENSFKVLRARDIIQNLQE